MIGHVKYRLHKNKRPLRYELLQQLLHNQSLSVEQLLEKQRRDLANMVAFAASHTDYYQHAYRGLLADDLTQLDITRLPILGKEAVIANRERMVADTIDKATMRLGYTGGSTGQPVSFYYDDYKMELMRAGMSRSYMWSGWRPGQKILNFWGAKQDLKANSLGKRYHDFIAAEQTIGAYEYGEEELVRWAQLIKSWQPVLIQGYASIIADVARVVIEHKIKLPKSIQGVYSTAEVLYDPQRELMEKAFHCPVTNQYGCREIPNIALECRHGNMHVFTDMVKLESGEDDRLLITSLTNFLMPMLRYANGDTGRLKAGQCTCGSPFPMMEMGMCRSNDFIKTSSGKKIAPSYFNRLLDGVSGIKQYQFIQTEIDQLILNINATTKLDKGLQQAMQNKILTEVDPSMRFEIVLRDDIKRTVSGKYRFVISHIR